MFRLLVGLCLIGSCTHEQAPAPTFQVSDSAGIRIVTNVAPSWGAHDAWHVTDTAVVEIGDAGGTESYELYNVSDARRMRDGTIVVADGGTNELRFFDKDGRFVRSKGGTGRGPGQFMRVDRLFVSPSDSIIVSGIPYISLFDDKGDFIRTVRHAYETDDFFSPRVVGLLGSHVLLLTGVRYHRADSVTSGVTRQLAHYATLNIVTHEIDQIGTYLRYETYIGGSTGGVGGRVYPFGKTGHIAGHANVIVVGDNTTYSFEMRDGRGRLQTIVRVAHSQVAVTDELLEAWIVERLAPYRDKAPQTQLSQWRRGFHEYPVAENLPAFSSLMIDDLGYVWVEDFNMADTVTYQVFNGDGVWLGGVRMPAGLKPFDIGPDFVLGLRRNAVDVELIALHELIRPSAP